MTNFHRQRTTRWLKTKYYSYWWLLAKARGSKHEVQQTCLIFLNAEWWISDRKKEKWIFQVEPISGEHTNWGFFRLNHPNGNPVTLLLRIYRDSYWSVWFGPKVRRNETNELQISRKWIIHQPALCDSRVERGYGWGTEPHSHECEDFPRAPAATRALPIWNGMQWLSFSDKSPAYFRA